MEVENPIAFVEQATSAFVRKVSFITAVAEGEKDNEQVDAARESIQRARRLITFGAEQGMVDAETASRLENPLQALEEQLESP